MYHVDWKLGRSFYQFAMDWLNLDQLVEPLTPATSKSTGQPLVVPVVEHVAVTLQRPEHAARQPGGRGTQMFFDGGVQVRVGSGGYLVWDDAGMLLAARGCWFGAGAPTNNTAELRALVRALEFV